MLRVIEAFSIFLSPLAGRLLSSGMSSCGARTFRVIQSPIDVFIRKVSLILKIPFDVGSIRKGLSKSQRDKPQSVDTSERS